MEGKGRRPDNEILFVGHLEEVDDLKRWERDAPLDYDREDNIENLKKISDALVEKIRERDKKAVLLISSPKIRAQQTSEWIAKELKSKLGDNIKVRYSVDENLDANSQGKFILPENYTPGSFFEGLKIAGKIYLKESLNQTNSNLHYKFGDPVLQTDGTYKYPELAKYFTESGETYAESLVRIFTSVIEMSSKARKLNSSSVEVVVVAHGFTYHVLKGLTVLGEQIMQGETSVNLGEVAQKIWEIYNTRTSELKDTSFAILDFSNIENEELLSLLRKEINYLKR